MVKLRHVGLTSGRPLLAILCGTGAIFLFVAALMVPKQGDGFEQWLPLNAEVREALDQMDEAHAAREGATADGDGQGKGADSAAAPGDALGEMAAKPSEADDSSAKPDVVPSVSPASGSGKLDINRATVAELDELKGIGPAKARAIVEERERAGYFRSVDELLRVKGIGEKLLAGLKESVVANP